MLPINHYDNVTVIILDLSACTRLVGVCWRAFHVGHPEVMLWTNALITLLSCYVILFTNSASSTSKSWRTSVERWEIKLCLRYLQLPFWPSDNVLIENWQDTLRISKCTLLYRDPERWTIQLHANIIWVSFPVVTVHNCHRWRPLTIAWIWCMACWH